MKSLIFCSLMTVPLTTFAQEPRPIEGQQLERIAARLSEEVADIENPQVEVTADLEKASGLVLRQDGVVCLPHEGLSEETVGANAQTESGTPLGYLFMTENFVPVVNGRQVADSELRILNLTDEQGRARNIKCFLLAARQIETDDWRLYAYGSEEEPVVDAKFEPADTSVASGPVSLNIVDVQGTEGTLRVTVFSKYRSGMRISYQGD